jgi:hypothetical protein
VAQIRRIVVEQFPALKVERPDKLVSAAADLLERIVTCKAGQCASIAIDGNITQRRWLTLHDRATAEMGLDVGVVGRHQGNDRLAQTGRRFGTKVIAHEGIMFPNQE